MAVIDKVFPSRSEVVSDERYGGPDVGDYCGDIGTLITHCLHCLPRHLGGERGEEERGGGGSGKV